MNRLAHESSPYLLQHAANPVDWYPWGEEAFGRALAEDKPILLSVGYSTCHWCHVMAHESFEDERVAAYMNAHFVNVKLDREERPDVDAVYMAAVQAMTSAGGWPMTVFLMPDGRPFYAGTYFPPTDRQGMPGFARVLQSVAAAWAERRDDLRQNADALTEHVQAISAPRGSAQDLPPDLATRGLEGLHRLYDPVHGGFGSAPKFPAPTLLAYLLTQPEGREMALSTLRFMARGGLHDQLGGGFHRYSVDARWLVPHFEKMLYDNAQLTRAYLWAWQVSGDGAFLAVARDTLAYLEREMRAPEGGFYSAQDADQEGIEGQFFVWTPGEFRDLLGDDAALAARHWGVTDAGNFMDPHHPEFGRRSVLSVVEDEAGLAAHFDLPVEEVRARLERARAVLFEAREARPRPGLDDKVLTSWNGLALMAFAEAARLTGDAHLLEVARQNADFIRARLQDGQGGLLHVFGGGQARVAGLLEDQAIYALGLIELYRAGGDLTHLHWARDLWAVSRRGYFDEASGVFLSTGAGAEALIARRAEGFDAAVISDNAAAALLGAWIARYFDDADAEAVAARVVRAYAPDLLAAPSGFGGLWQVHALLQAPRVEVAVLGAPQQRAPFERALAGRFLPFVALAPAEGPGGLPLLEDRRGEGVAFVCRNFACDLPARDVGTFEAQLAALGD